MEQLASKSTITVYLSGHEPVSTSYNINLEYITQGTTNIVFNLSNIDTSIYGLYKIILSKDSERVTTLNSIVSGNNTFLPKQTIDYLFIPTSDTNTLTLSAYYRNGKTTTYNILLYTTLDNILDMDFTIINTQTVYSNGRYIPVINFESNNNTVYPVAYFEELSGQSTNTSIYLTTNPEINASLSAASFELLKSSNIINTESSNRIDAV